MVQRIRKAVFPVAGFGTRFLPVTKAMPKELLPVAGKPIIQYAVEEAIQAGIDTLVFVTGRHKRAIEDHFDSNPELEHALKAKGKHAEADMVRNILPKGIECIFVRQPEQLGLGHAVLCAERAIGGEPFAIILADDFLCYDNDGVTKQLVEAFASSNKSQISVMEVEGEDISKYGAVVPGSHSGLVAGLVEKPHYKSAPSNLASIGRYVVESDIFNILKKLAPGAGGEIQLADAIHILALNNRVSSQTMHAKRFDCGSVSGYLEAIKYVASKDN
jgi:UTP--glucose-1-phosphate uridylyltransferase